MPSLKVLLVEDREDDEILISRSLSRAGYDVQLRRVSNEEAMREALLEHDWDVILSDYALPEFSCQRALGILQSSGLDIPFIALSGTVSEETILTLLRAGARDYVMKDNLARLPSSVEREVREAENRRQRKRLEAQLNQAMKMEAIGRLAGGVAHDFNNLLTVITGFAQLALLDEQPSKAGLEEIIQAAERASGLTRQLLAFSRQQALEPRIFDLNFLVRDMEKMLRRLIGEDVEISTHLAAEALHVKADPGQIEQVVFNLAVNARDAMPEGGKLTLSTSRRTLDRVGATLHGLQEGDYCVVSVRDNGSGIDPEVLPHIFEPFFTTKPEGQGTGLGLSTVYGIMQQSGGAIHADSKKDAGTTMTMFIPASGGSLADDAVAAAPAREVGRERVLVAEDDANVRRLIVESLRVRGFQMLQARDGEEALAILSGSDCPPIDLLITDVVMPGMTGPTLAQQASLLFPKLRILFMSGYTEEVVQHHGIASGSAAFLQKPFAPRDLVRKARELLDATVV